ncbi:hypothetical protein RB653_008156 [Dictyostelium firmibasis]|uniref:Kinetochore protein Sos7 coiled-coil domain-containing protein n=1 Tax=Dictyostelium firmibasis TaxID=79012 RepID=A0AAN7TZW9_9MYCE
MGSNNDNNILFVNQVGELLTRYNDEIGQLNKGLLDYYYNNGFDKKNLNSIEKELSIVQDCFSKMKWNYIENGTKQLFIKEIISETQITTPSQHNVHSLEDQLKEIKNDFNNNKEKTKKAFEQIIEIISRFSEMNEKYQKEKQNLQSSISKANELIERILKLVSNNSITTTTPINNKLTNKNNNSNNTVVNYNNNLNSSIQWYKKYNKFLESMGGLYIIPNNDNNIIKGSKIEFELKIDTPKIHKLIIELEENNDNNNHDDNNKNNEKNLPIIKGYKLVPNINELNKVLQDTISDFSNINEPLESFSDIGDLVGEFKNIISNYYLMEAEIQDLSLRFKIKRQPLKNYGEISIQLPTGFTCNLYLDSDYPKYSTIEIQSIQKPNSNELLTNLSFIQKNINENKWNLLQLIEEVDYYLK